MYIKNLRSIIDQLLATGLTQRAIAEAAKCEEAVVHRLRTGKQANIYYSTGKRIEKMARDHGIKI